VLGSGAVERKIEPMMQRRFKKRGMRWRRTRDSCRLHSLVAEELPSLGRSCQSAFNLGQRKDRARIDRRWTQM